MSEALLKIEEEELAGYGRLGELNKGRDGMELVRLAGKTGEQQQETEGKG